MSAQGVLTDGVRQISTNRATCPDFKVSALSITGRDMTQRGTCWSITINNPTDEDMNPSLQGGWKLEGQMEKGEEGTTHFQGMLSTPQTRFSSVKKVFPRAHIELAKNRSALQKYVHKELTREQEVETKVSNIPTLWDYSHSVAERWNHDDWVLFRNRRQDEDQKRDIGDIALDYVDSIVASDIEDGMNGVEFIAINPMFRSAWKKFWRSMIHRAEVRRQQTDRQTDSDQVIEEKDDE